MRWGVLLLVFVMVLPRAVTAQTPEASPSAIHPACSDLPAYRAMIVDAYMAIPASEREEMRSLTGLSFSEMRPSQLRLASSVFDQFATNMEAIPLEDVPAVAHPYHRANITLLSVASNTLNALATGGPLSALMYQDQGDAAMRTANSADTFGRASCGTSWDEILNDGLIPVSL